MQKQFYVNILASRRNGTLYIGVTSNLVKRVWENKNKMVEGFTEEYNVRNLVYYEVHSDAETAITREKRMKKRIITHAATRRQKTCRDRGR